MIEKRFKINGNSGFARPAILLVRVASMFTSTFSFEYQGESVDLKNSSQSVMDLMSLEMGFGAYFTIRVEGIDEQHAFHSIENYLSNYHYTRN